MMAKDFDLTRQRHKERQRQVKTYGTETPLSSAAIERGSTRWLDGSRVDIEGILNLIGTGNVSGVLDVSGTLNGSGETNLSGVNNLSGENHLTGPTDVAGNFEIIAGGQFKAGESVINPDGSAQFGALDISADGQMKAGQFTLNPDGSADFGTFSIASDGTLTVRNDVNVTSGGKITAGNLEIEPANGGQINFLGGSLSSSAAFGALLNNNTAVELQAPTVRLRATTTEAIGQLKVNSTPVKPASELTPLGIDTSGVICRIA